ncbi:MAG TPA: gephyrin-like molybdotransferase Glp [Methylomirabilota bacterium]|jgi:molybdopterin molybdotransferase|nr:gephyrin-like molybdotransferase Glp [Methylomirabilota bacterium]
MISVADAQARILAEVGRVAPPEVVPVGDCLGRVLAEDVRAAVDVPPTDNSAVDGYAVRSADIPVTGLRQLRVVGDLPAGAVFDATLGPGEALRIMTGAPVPAGADTVYPQEVVERSGPVVRIPSSPVGVNVRHRGEDVRAGTAVLPAGSVLRPQELGVAASLGLPQLLVRQRPRVAILSTGDEVVEPGDARKPGQIFDSNRFSLHGLVEAAGGEPTDHGIVPDLYDVLHARLRAAAATADIVLTSGGVSVGDYDLVKAVLQDAGGIDFWQVAMQPGRPLAVGRIGAAHFFGLPGNPVASMLTFHLFVRPALWKLAGRRDLFPPRFHAVAMEPMSKKTGRREFKRGILSYTGQRWEVRITGPQGSGILTSMTLANCFVVIEEERGDVAAGDTVSVEPFAVG